jgi:DNA-binding beta-propeller fold protein YncE
MSPAGLHVTQLCVSVSWRQAGVRIADGFRGEDTRVISTPRVKSFANGLAVSRDGSTLLVTDSGGGSHAIHEFRVADGSRLRIIGGEGVGPLLFDGPRQLWIASDDFVFVADYGNNRVQVLTPRLDFHGFVGAGQLKAPCGVCANDAVIVVSEADYAAHRITVFKRCDGALLRRFGSQGRGDGQLQHPRGLCFLSGSRHIAVAEWRNHRVSVFSIDGEFVRHVGVGKLSSPDGVVHSSFDELVVADAGNERVAVFGANGELLKAMKCGRFGGVAIHDGTVFAHGRDNEEVAILTSRRSHGAAAVSTLSVFRHLPALHVMRAGVSVS